MAQQYRDTESIADELATIRKVADMRKKIPLLVILALSVATVRTANGGPSSRASIVTLTTGADAIVTGSVDATVVNQTVNATIHVERVLKGKLSPGSSIPVLWSMAPNPYASGKPWSSKGHGLFFMRLTAAGTWSLLPATTGDAAWTEMFIATPVTVPQGIRDVAGADIPAAATPLDNVILEIVIATEVQGRPPVDLAWLFRESKSPVLAGALTRFRSKSDVNLNATGLLGSVMTNDPGVIHAVYRSYARLSSALEWRSLVDQIKYYYVNTSVPTVQVLGQMVLDPKVPAELRTAAAAVLARMHTQHTLPYLVKLLDEQNITLKAAAVGGLASFANNVPIGSHEPAPGAWVYRTEETIAHSSFDEAAIASRESYFVGFWKAWWQENQSKLAQ